MLLWRVCFQHLRLGRIALLVVLIAGIVSNQSLPVNAGSTEAAGPSASPRQMSPAAPSTVGRLVQAAHPLPGMDAAPSTGEATVIDQHNPAWVTHYGTEAGQKLLPPRQPTFEALPQGPSITLGAWQSFNLGGNLPIVGTVSTWDGRLFAAVSTDGLRVYAPNANGIYGWTAIHAGLGSLTSDNVSALAILGSDLWVGTTDDGAAVMNLNSGVWRYYQTSNSGLASNHILRFTVTDDQPGEFEMWISTANGASVYSFDGVSEGWVTYFSGSFVFDVAQQVIGNVAHIWLASNSTTLYRLDGSTWTPFNSGNTGACGMDQATRMVVDNNNTVWFAAEHFTPGRPNGGPGGPSAPAYFDQIGACTYTAGGTWTLYNSTVPGLPSNQIDDMTVDGAGRVWMATQLGGVAYDQGSWLIITQAAGYPLTSNQIHTVQAVGDDIWFGHYDLTAFDVYSPNWQREDYGIFGIPSALFIEPSVTWAGVSGALWWRDAASWHARTIPGNSSAVTSFTRDVSGTLWIGTAGSGLFTFDGTNFTHQTTADGLPSNTVRALLSDHVGRLWVATSGGLALRGNGYWLTFTQANSALTSDDLRALTGDLSDRLWIGTGNTGLNVFDPNAHGQNPWSSQTTANGLPSNTINALATDPSGAVWAATPAGVAVSPAAHGSWQVYDARYGDLPSNNALAIASDPQGRLWIGTDKGLALREGNSWQIFHVTGSMAGSDHISAVAADGNLMWVAAGSVIATRGVLTGPIGFFAPLVSSVTPSQGAPFTEITITGAFFDGRAPAYNTVRFADHDGIDTIPAQVTAATQNSLSVQVPGLANSGRILVTAHGLSGQSPAPFTIVPQITQLSATCLGLGDLLTISGDGFASGGSTSVYVQIGAGPWRQADASDSSSIRQFIWPGDTAGPVSIKVGLGGVVVTSADSISIATPQVASFAAQQAVQGLPMIWGKETLVQLALQSTGAGCDSHVDNGFIEWKKKDGTTQPDSIAFISPAPSGLVVKPNALPISLATAASFESVAGFGFADFDGVRIHLSNGPVELFAFDFPASAFNFIDVGTPYHALNIYVYPTFMATDAERAQFMAQADAGLREVERVFPQAGDWMTWADRTIGESAPVNLGNNDTFSDLKDQVDDIRTDLNDNDGGNFDQAVGVIDQNLYPASTPRGKATTDCGFLGGVDCDQQSTVAFNLANQLVAPYLQEFIHASSWVDSGSPNYATYNPYHSRYDEAQTTTTCTQNQTYRQALIDQLGFPARSVVLDFPPVEFPLTGCNPSTQPRSIMSYAPSDNNINAFLEPIDYNHELAYIELVSGVWAQSKAAAGLAASSGVTQTLRLAGTIDAPGSVSVTLSYLLGVSGTVTLPTPGGHYHLDLRAADNRLLLDFPFNVASAATIGGVLNHFRFNLRVPFPANATQVEIWHDTARLYASRINAHAPSVSFVGPTGGTYSADSSIPVAWSVTNPDGVPLQVSLDYSADNGATWTGVAIHLSGQSYTWQPGFVPPSNQGRLRLRVSDGFHVAAAVSNPFTLTAHPPVAIIRTPRSGQAFTEGSLLNLLGGSQTSDGKDQGTFQWLYDGSLLGSGQKLSTTLGRVGTHTLSLQVTSHGLVGTQSITISVLADYAHTGLPDGWLQQYKLNPLDPTAAYADPIGKGLTNLQNYQLGLNPLLMDTDGSGSSDAAEVAAGLDPLQPNQKLPTQPTLDVGANSLGFSMRRGDPAPAPWNIWIANGGPGTLNWTVSGGAPWLSVSPTHGSAPTQVTIAVRPAGLSNGIYTSQITFSAAGVVGSPHTVLVTLNVGDVATERIYLPFVSRQ